MNKIDAILAAAMTQGLAGPKTAVARLGAIEAKLDDMVSGPAGLDERLDDIQAQVNEMEQHMRRLTQLNHAQLDALRSIAALLTGTENGR